MSVSKLAVYARTVAAVSVLGVLAAPNSAHAVATPVVPPPVSGPNSVSSSPHDKTVYNGRSPVRGLKRAPAGVFLIDATASAGSTGGGEPGLAVNPANPNQVAITRFGGSTWNAPASLLYSTNGGQNWADEASVPPPPGVPGTAGCPCDQTIDYGRDGRLYGTFLTFAPGNPPLTQVVTGSTTNPAQASSWHWNGNPAQLTSGNRTQADQPWLLINRDPNTASQDNAYVAYDDFGAAPDARVAVSYGADPVNITADHKAGTEFPLVTNPGLRLATDHRNGTVYALYQQSTGNIVAQPKTVTYKLNRSTDGGATWSLNGSADGLTVDTVPSDQAPGYKFATNNALLGGVDHAAVDPSNGDVYVAYGQDAGGNNQIKIRRLTPNGSGGLTAGPATNVSTSTNAALPSVAVLADGTVGVLYDTYDGTTVGGFPIVSAHLARSTDHGATFSDVVLQTFQTPQNNGDPRQRVLGDFHQLKAVGNTFHGVFAGNLSGVPATNPPIHALYFRAADKNPAATTLSSSVNPSRYGQAVTFTDTVCPADPSISTATPTGTVTFRDGNNVLGTGTLSPGGGTYCSRTHITTPSLAVGPHTITASYSGDDNYLAGPLERLAQRVNKSGVTTGLVSSANPSIYGHSVTFTDTVCPAHPTAAPTGTVTFKDGKNVLGTRTLSPGGGTHCSRTKISTSRLQPARHTITAFYSGDGNYLAGPLERLTQNVKCPEHHSRGSRSWGGSCRKK